MLKFSLNFSSRSYSFFTKKKENIVISTIKKLSNEDVIEKFNNDNKWLDNESSKNYLRVN